MPRIACIETGRPVVLSWRRPAQSVHGISSVICSLESGVGQLAAMRRIVVGRDAAARGDGLGRVAVVEKALGDQCEGGPRPAAVGERGTRRSAPA